jgi:hypothetical protein
MTVLFTRLPSRCIRGNVYTVGGRHSQAIATFREAIAHTDSATWAIGGLAYVLARAGDSAARNLMPLLEARGLQDPILFAALGLHERAVTTIEASAERSGLRAFHGIRCFPEFVRLRQDSRIQVLADRLGLQF